MARTILGIGCSHSPMLALEVPDWEHRAAADRTNRALNLSDGRKISYDALVAERGERYGDLATAEQFDEINQLTQAALDRLSAELAAADPDVVVIVGDDQGELFSLANMPAASIFYGNELATSDIFGRADAPDWVQRLSKGYAMDEVRRHPVAAEFGRALIELLVDDDVDMAAAAMVEDPRTAGFGHAFGFIISRLLDYRPVPVVPILLNTYFPPNVISARRAYDIGTKLDRAIDRVGVDARVAIIASGGLSHFVTDEALDARVIAGLEPGQEELLRSIPRGALNDGSSEILNWILMAGATRRLTKRWIEYHPVFRTPAGTGCGLAFGAWGEATC